MTKKEVKDQSLLIGIIILIIIFGTVIFLIYNKTNNPKEDEITVVEYNGFIFEKHGNFWVTLLTIEDQFDGWKRDYEFTFHYNPFEVEHIETMKNSRNETVTPNLFLNVQTIYLTTDPEYPAGVILGAVEIAKVLGNIYEKEVKSATTRPDNRTDAPVITCEDIGPDQRVIQLILGNSTRIYNNKGCIIVEGTNTINVVKASERLAFEMLRIL